MENFDFDNKIKEGLDNINPMLNNDEIWDNIEPKLKKKKKRRLIIWFFLGALGILGLLWLQSGDSNQEVSFSKTDVREEASIIPIAQNTKKDDFEVLEKTSITNDSNDQTEIKKEDQLRAKKVESKIGSSISSDQNIEKKSTAKSLKLVEQTSNPTIQSQEKVEVPITNSISIVIENNPPKSEINTLVIDKKIEKETDTPILDKSELPSSSTSQLKVEATLQKADDSATEAKDVVVKDIVPTNNEPEEVKKKLTKKEREEANEKRKKERKKAKDNREKKRKEDAKKAEQEKNKLTKPNKLPIWKFQLQLMGSGIYTLHNVKYGSLPESEYSYMREKYVKGTEGFGTEISLVAESPSGFLITAGIQYQQLHEKIERQETILTSEFQDVTETVTEDGEGNVINFTSSMQLVTTTTTYNQQLYNKYRFLNLPLGIGYAFKTKNMRLKLLGGVDLSAYYRFSGSMFSRDLSIIELKSKNATNYDKIYKNKVGLGIWASVEWHKPLNERLSLVVAPGIQAPIGSITQNIEEWPISHKLLKLKLGVGINYLFSGRKESKKRSRKG